MPNSLNILMAKQRYEVKLSLSKVFLIPFLIILIIALGFVQYGTAEYKKKALEEKTIFNDIEFNKVSQFTNYRQYGFYGFRLLFLPAPLSILFSNSTSIQNMSAYIDSGERLNIYKPLKGRTMFETNKYLFSDFSGIFLFFFGLLSLFYGFITFYYKDFLRSLASIADEKKLFITTLVSRAIMLCLCVFLFLVAAMLLIAINGISISIDRYLFMLFMSMCGVSIFFFVAGSFFGAWKSSIKGFLYSIATWFVLLFIVSFLISMIVSYNSNMIKQEYQLELEKLKMMMDFEKRSNEIAGVLPIDKKPADIDRELVMSYYKNEFPKMQRLETEVQTQMQDLSKLHFILSALFPTTAYLAFTNEISSKGYKNLDSFYQEVQKIKEDFFKEYMAKVYFSPQPAKVEPFLKGDQNIFVGKPAFPDYFALSILIDLFWIALLVVITYYNYHKFMFSLPAKEKGTPESKDVRLVSSDINTYMVQNEIFNRQIYNFMYNKTKEFSKKGYSYKLYLNDQLINTSTQKQDFIYVPHYSKLPGEVKVDDYSTLLMDLMEVDKSQREEIKTRFGLDSMGNKKISDLDVIEKSKLSLSILAMKTFDVYVIDDLLRDIYIDQCLAFDELVSDLKQKGKTIVLITTGYNVIRKCEFNNGKYFRIANDVNLYIEKVKAEKAADNAEKEN